ncbi:unnamed protein product, partial [Iphiclides podalirius]
MGRCALPRFKAAGRADDGRYCFADELRVTVRSCRWRGSLFCHAIVICLLRRYARRTIRPLPASVGDRLSRAARRFRRARLLRVFRAPAFGRAEVSRLRPKRLAARMIRGQLAADSPQA